MLVLAFRTEQQGKRHSTALANSKSRPGPCVAHQFKRRERRNPTLAARLAPKCSCSGRQAGRQRAFVRSFARPPASYLPPRTLPARQPPWLLQLTTDGAFSVRWSNFTAMPNCRRPPVCARTSSAQRQALRARAQTHTGKQTHAHLAGRRLELDEARGAGRKEE